MKLVSQTAKDLGADLTLPGVSATDAALAMEGLAKGGLSVDEALAAAKGTIQLAAAAGVEVGEAAEFAADNLNMFDLAGKDAQKVADILANAANKTTGEIGDFALALKQAGTVANKQFGLSIYETTALLMELADAGIKGSDAGTSLKTMLTRLVAPTDKAAAVMKDLGVATFDTKGNVRDIRDVIGDWQQALGPLTDAQRAQALQTVFGADAIRAANVIFGEGVKGYDEMARAAGESGTAQEIAAGKMEGLAGKWEGFKSSVETLAITVGELFLPMATDIVGKAGEMVGALDKIISTSDSVGEAFGKIGDAIQKKLGAVDWGEVARTVGEKLNAAFSKGAEWLTGIDWSKPAGAIKEGLAAAFGKEDFSGVGSEVASSVEAGLEGGDWSGVAASAASEVRTAMEGEDWSATIEPAESELQTAWETLDLDWSKVGEGIGSGVGMLTAGVLEGLAKVDWVDVADAIGSGLIGAVESAFEQGQQAAEDSGFADFMYDLGYDSATKFLEGFESVQSDFEAIDDFFNDIFGTGSSTDAMMSELESKLNEVGLTWDETAGKAVAFGQKASQLPQVLNPLARELLHVDDNAGGLADALIDAGGKVSTFGGSANTATPKISGMTGELKAMRGAVEKIPDKSVTNVSTPGAEESKRKADDVDTAVRNIPNSSKTNISTSGVSSAIGSIGQVASALAGLQDKTVYVSVVQLGHTIGYQHGGIVRSPLAMVGEAGPELVALPRGSRVFSNPESRRMMAGHGGGVGQTINHFHFHGHVMSERDAAHTIQNALLQGPGSTNPSLFRTRA